MKNKLLIIALCATFFTQAQITKMETFLTGTKVSFYPNECGNTIPEAQGKLTFCDSANNLGVVDRSYGLNARGVKQMLPNYHNQDEIYLTSKGISIHNEDGTWENIPNMAIPLNGTTYIPAIQNGLILPDGKIIIQATNAGYLLNVYDRTLKTFTQVNFPDFKYPQQVLYDADRNLTWAFASSSNTTYLFSYDGTTLTEIANLGTIAINSNGATLIYKDNYIYIGNYYGLYKIDVSNYTSSVPVTHYNSTTTPSLLFDTVGDLQFDTNNNLWIANSENYNGAILKFNITTETYDAFQTPRPDNAAININFNKLAIDETGLVWAVAQNYYGLVKLTVAGTTPTWEFVPVSDLTTLGVPIVYIPNHVYFRNNKFYFTTHDGSSGDNDKYEVIINNNGVWSGRNDNEIGNLSQRMNSRFTENLPDNNGGVWWFNNYDDIVVYRDSDDNHQFMLIDLGYNNQAIDVDNKAIIKGGTPNEIRKIDFPNAISIQSATNHATQIKQVANQTWVYDKSVPKIDIYQNDNLVTTHILDETDYQYIYYMAVDDDANPWFARYVGGNQLQIKKFDTTTATTTTFNQPEYLGALVKILAAPNNAIWFVGRSGIMYYENGNFHSFLAADYLELGNINDAVVDSNGKLYLMNTTSFSGTITTFENPTATTPTIISQRVTSGYNSPLLPSFGNIGSNLISIDSEGSVWTFAGAYGAIKIVDNDFAVEYRRQAYTAGENQQVINTRLNIYPNPTIGIINISTNETIDKIEVYSVLGKKVAENTNSDTININKLKTGIYLIKIISENKTVLKKIIKQ